MDRIDLYWVHVWDQLTPAEEVLRTLADAVARGEILYYGFSNAPSWYVAKIATPARAHAARPRRHQATKASAKSAIAGDTSRDG